MSEIEKIFRSVLNINNADCIREVEEVSTEREYIQGELTVIQGELQHSIPFIVKGSFLGYYIDSDGKRFTDCVTDFYGCPVTAVSELMNFAKPSEVSFEALEDSSVLLVPIETVVRIVMTYPEVAEAMNRIVLVGFSYHKNFQHLNALPLSKRYTAFCEFYPELSERLSRTSVAACLNTSIQALSHALSECEAV